MPQLHVLHLSGNHLVGSIPDISDASGIQNLSLAQNKLTGTIPASILNHPFLEIDLSHNRITGTLDKMKRSPAGNASYVIKNNRFSGDIPHVLLSDSSLDVNLLEGNTFSCSDASGQPDSDPRQGQYACGSSSIDNALTVWFCTGVVSLILVLILTRFGYLTTLYQHLQYTLSILSQFHLIYERRLQEKKDQSYPSSTSLQKEKDQILNRLETSQAIHLSSMHSLQRLSIRITMFYLFFVMPILAILKSLRESDGSLRFSTYTVQHTWYPSGVYLSGTIPALLYLLCWTVVILYVLWSIMSFHHMFRRISYPKPINTIKSPLPVITQRSSRSEMEIQNDDKSEVSDLDDDDSVEMNSDRNTSGHDSNSGVGLGRGFDLKIIMRFLDSCNRRYNCHVPTHLLLPLSRILLTLFLLTVVTLDILLVFTINFSYLLLQESHASSFYKFLGQITLALFKTLFSNTLVPSLTSWLFHSLHASRSFHLFIRTLSLVINNVIIPAIVISLTSSSCFLNVFYANDPSNESYQLTNSTAMCDYQLTETGLVVCNEKGTAYFESESFIPQFTYNYECSHYFITTFVPVYIYSYALLSFITPILTGFLLLPEISSFIPKRILPFLPVYLLPLHESAFESRLSRKKQVSISNALGMMSSLLFHFCLLMVLGIIVPFLGIIISLHITIMVIQYDVLIGRYFSNSKYSNSIGQGQTEEGEREGKVEGEGEGVGGLGQVFMDEVRSIWRGPYLLANYLIVIVVMLMACFLLDQASDHSGWRQGVWVIPCVMIVTCLPAWLLWRYQPTLRRWKNQMFQTQKITEEEKERIVGWDTLSMLDVSLWMSLVDQILFNESERSESYERIPLQERI